MSSRSCKASQSRNPIEYEVRMPGVNEQHGSVATFTYPAHVGTFVYPETRKRCSFFQNFSSAF